MRKNILVMCLFIVLFTLTACGDDEVVIGVSDDIRYSLTYQIASISAEGVFRVGADNMLHFRSEQTGEDMIFCYDPNCIHEPASYDNPDPICRGALFPNAKTRITYYEGYVYYFVSEGLFEHKIYRMKANGAGRELIAEIPYGEDVLLGIVFYEDKMYYTALERIPIDDMGNLEKHFYIMEYDLLSGKYRFVTPDLLSVNTGFWVTEEYIYYRTVGGENGRSIYVKRFNKTTLEEEVVVTPERYLTYRVMDPHDDYYLYYNGKDTVGVHNLKTGEDTVLFCEEGKQINPHASKNGIFYMVYDETETGESIISGYYFYDLLTGETTDITEAGTEYNICSYDGYNGVFICNQLHDIRVINEDKILGNQMTD